MAQNEDTYSARAKKEGYPARSVYKLQEIDHKYKVFKKGDNVLDLGCAPGSWMIYIADRIGEKGMVTGIDVQGIDIRLGKNMQFIRANVFDFKGWDLLFGHYDAIVSDLAPATSGIRSADAEKSLELCERVWSLSQKYLKPKGIMICKIFESEMTDEFFRKIKENFDFTKRFIPKAVKKQSRELYIIAIGFRAS